MEQREIQLGGGLRWALFGIGVFALIGVATAFYLLAIGKVPFSLGLFLRLIGGGVIGVMFLLPAFMMGRK